MSQPTDEVKTPYLGVIAFLCLLFVSVGIYLLMQMGGKDRGHDQARKDIMGLVTATKGYQIQYGKLPLREVARFEDEATQARLLRVLQALDTESNPRGIWFFEADKAQKHPDSGSAKYRAGIHPESGAFLDPWGNPYRVRFAQAQSDRVESPYLDERAEELQRPAIAWSLGKDGVQGSPGKENILEGSDDIVSWR